MQHIAHVLLADILQQQQKYKDAANHFEEALKLIKALKEKDSDLEVEIEIARSECSIEMNANDIIPRLHQLARSFNTGDSDTKRVSLQAIVYDTLAKCCLKQENYELFESIAEESMSLKLRNFSQYHPSLAINLVLIAERLIQLSRYREALDFYEHALEVHSLNLADNHPKIRKVCYAMGDIYCKLDKLSMAIEKYDVAESKGSESDSDIGVRQEKINSKESMDICMARLRMHQNLAEYHAKKQNYKDCITEMYKNLDLLGKKLPSSAFNTNDEILVIDNNIDPTTLMNNLQQLVNCYLNRDVTFDSEEDEENTFKIAQDICEKLSQHDNDSTKAQLALMYHKLSSYYEDLGENQDALSYLQETTNFEEPTIETLYRLAYLNANRDEFEDAITNYKDLLDNEKIKDERIISQIIQDKLVKIKEKAKKARRSSSSTDEDTSDDSSVHRSSRTPSAISKTSGTESKSEANADSTS